MKFLLIEHRDGNDPALVTICETPDDRERRTAVAICGEADDSCPELRQLREDGIVRFEGDPPIEWLNAVVTTSDAAVDRNAPTPAGPWLGMESAPKDGTRILAVCGSSPSVIYYGGADSGWRHNCPGLPAAWPLPTRWMPVPLAS